MSATAARFTELSVLLERRFHVARVSVMPSTPLDDLGLDSLSLLAFVCAAENAFRSRVPAHRLDPASPDGPLTLQGLCELLGADSEAGCPA